MKNNRTILAISVPFIFALALVVGLLSFLIGANETLAVGGGGGGSLPEQICTDYTMNGYLDEALLDLDLVE